MALSDEFQADVEGFLRNHATIVRGGSDNSYENERVGTIIGNQGFAETKDTVQVSLQAPLVAPIFGTRSEVERNPYLDFTVDSVEVYFRSHNPGDVPVYLVPYVGRSGRGVKLPAHGSDAHRVAYAMTATLDGCTVEVSGTAQSPYVSHTNVRDAAAADREAAIGVRLNTVMMRFRAAETAANGTPGAPLNNRTQFGHYEPDYQGLATTAVNYTDQKVQAVARNSRPVKAVVREENTFSHYRYYAVPKEECVTNLRQRIPGSTTALVVGRRDAGGWKFFYQVHGDMRFRVKKVRKIQGLKIGSGEYVKGEFGGPVVLDYGELWPRHTPHLASLGSRI